MSKDKGKGNLFFTIGLPRSGKSTLCDQWIKHEIDIYQNQFQPRLNEGLCESAHIEGNPRVVVCADDIRIALTGCRFSSVSEETVHSIQGVMIRGFLARGSDVIVDGTHTTKHSISRMFKFDQNAQYVYINTSAEICIARAKAINQSDLIPVIEKMEDQLDELTYLGDTVGHNTINTKRIQEIKDGIIPQQNVVTL